MRMRFYIGGAVFFLAALVALFFYFNKNGKFKNILESSPIEEKHKVVYVLALDGGGIRGISSALILAEIEKKTGKKITELFDLVVGTSIGAMQTGFLNEPKSEKEKTAKYSANDLAQSIPTYMRDLTDVSFFHRVYTLNGMSSSLYSKDKKKQFIDNIFKDYTLGQSLKKVMIISYDEVDQEPFLFKSWNQDHAHLKMADILNWATNLPGLFPPSKVHIEGKDRYLLDGAFIFDNPALLALVEAYVLYPTSKIVIVSIGTGYTNIEKKNEKANTLVDFFKIAMDSTHEGYANKISLFMRLFEKKKLLNIARYYRLSVAYPDNIGNFMDTSSDNIKNIENSTKRYIKKNDEFISIVANDLLGKENLLPATHVCEPRE